MSTAGGVVERRTSPDRGHGSDDGPRHALARRVLADVIDVVVAGAAVALGGLGAVVVVIVTSAGESSAPTVGIIAAGALVVIGLLLALVVIVGGDVRGTSPGRRIAGVRLVAADGERPVAWRGLARGAVRTLALALLALDTTLGALVVGVLMGPALLGARGLGLHDRLLATRVVRRSAEAPEVVA